MTNVRCLIGSHNFALAETCVHLRHCTRCGRAYTGLARAWSLELRARHEPWLRQWFRAYVLRDPSWECGR